MKRNKGFTLVELIIVIAILAIIMLIGTLAYGGIQERMRIRADKATCAEIGKALAVREADVPEDRKIGLYPEVVEYNEFGDISTYIQDDLVPQSMPDGGYIVTAVQTNAGKKILVGIGKEELEINGDSIYQNKEEIGWVFSEGKDIVGFLDENGEKMDEDAEREQSGEKNVRLKSGIGGSVSVAKYYTVTYNANGGSGAPAPQKKTPGEDLTLTLDVPSHPDGLTFADWSTSADGDGTFYGPGCRFSIDADVVLYAQWTSGDIVQ